MVPQHYLRFPMSALGTIADNRRLSLPRKLNCPPALVLFLSSFHLSLLTPILSTLIFEWERTDERCRPSQSIAHNLKDARSSLESSLLPVCLRTNRYLLREFLLHTPSQRNPRRSYGRLLSQVLLHPALHQTSAWNERALIRMLRSHRTLVRIPSSVQGRLRLPTLTHVRAAVILTPLPFRQRAQDGLLPQSRLEHPHRRPRLGSLLHMSFHLLAPRRLCVRRLLPPLLPLLDPNCFPCPTIPKLRLLSGWSPTDLYPRLRYPLP